MSGSTEVATVNNTMALNQSRETSSSAMVAAAQAQVLARMQQAMIRPRDENRAAQRLHDACSRLSFAEEAMYAFPRGGSTVEGPSVNIAREAARVFGNMEYGIDVVSEDDDYRTIRGWAWDLETNMRVSADDTFQKLIQRKGKGWIKPDERDLRELTNRRGAILERNAILKLVPRDIVEEACLQAKRTIEANALKNLPDAIKKVVAAFQKLNVDVRALEKWAGVKIAAFTPEHVAKLNPIWKSINDGNSRWAEYLPKEEGTVEAGGDEKPSTATVDVDAIMNGATASAEPNRGHGEDGLDAIAQDRAENASDAPLGGSGEGMSALKPENAAQAQPAGESGPSHRLILQQTVAAAKGNQKKADDWMKKATASILPHGEARTFESITDLEAKTVLDAVNSGEYLL